MALLWGNLAAVAATLIIGLLTYRERRVATSAATSVQHRTVSLDEMEKALTWTSSQLTDLRVHAVEQDKAIKELQDAFDRCERDKRRLQRDIAELRGER